MFGPSLIRCLAVLACALFLLVPIAAGAQPMDCDKGCADFLAQEGITDPGAREQCVSNCQKLNVLGVEGFSFKCTYELPKACGAELAWDLIRYCVPPCIKFEKKPCENCMVTHGFCGAVSACRKWVCKCILKNQNCDYYYHHGCKK